MLQQDNMPGQLADKVMDAFIKRWLTALLALILVGCQMVPDSGSNQQDNDWQSSKVFFQQAYQKHADLQQWRYSAKVGVTTPESKEQANLVWTFDPQKNNIVRLYGPLGIGAIKIEFNDQQVTLSDRKGVLHRGDNAQRLLERIVGWTIPVDALHYWVFSLPMPSQRYEYKLDEQGQLSALRQLGWEIDYSSYREYKGGHTPFARKVIAKKQVSDEQTVAVTLVTRGWQF